MAKEKTEYEPIEDREEFLLVLKEHLDYKQTERFIKDQLEITTARIKQYVGKDTQTTIEEMGVVVKFETKSRKGIDSNKLKSEFPAIYAKVESISTYEQLSIKY